MAGLFGNATQRILMQRTADLHQTIMSTPGLCQAGRMMATDDPDQLGWDVIFEHLDRDGLFSFRMISIEQADDIERRLAQRGYRWDRWQVFTAPPDRVFLNCGSIVVAGLPDGYLDLQFPSEPDAPLIKAAQACLSESGVSPFSGLMLTGALCPAFTSILAGPEGDVAAVSHTYRPYNSFSRFADAAWVGLVAVSTAARGRGLGTYVNARAAIAACELLGAKRVDEMVRPGNIASRRMVEACGLELDPTLVCGVATRGEVRFTA